MRYQTLVQELKEVAESHNANETFFSGQEADINPSNNTRYPVVFLVPPKFSEQANNESLSSNTVWTIHMEAQELLSESSTTDQKSEALDRTREILRDVYFQFVLDGMDDKSITVNNVTEILDFSVSTAPEFAPFVDIGDNITGWQVDFAIQEGTNDNLCHLPDVFS